MNGARWNHQYLEANGIRIHHVRHGSGFPVVLLHGWPEFWFAWRKNIPSLAGRFDVVAPELRGFGDTEKPGLPDPPSSLPDVLVEDLRGLADALGIERFGIVSHDVGSYVAQAFARKYPERIEGLFFFNCFYPGIGRRCADPDHLKEIWYQSFNQQPWAPSLVGQSRQTCALYICHFLRHWSHAPDTFDDSLDAWVDNFMKPGNLQGGFDWYVGVHEARIETMKKGPPSLPKIEAPTRFLWGSSDPIIKAEWADHLSDYFANYNFALANEAGHFVHYEQPELANREIIEFFSALGA